MSRLSPFALSLFLLAAPLALLTAAPSAAWAGDAEAIEHYKKATSHWKDKDPAEAIKWAEKALEAAESKKIRMNVLFMLGQLHQGKTGDMEQALSLYEQIIRQNIGVQDPALKYIKAMALLNKGTILYSERDDVQAALAAYHASHQTFPSAYNADTLSQLLFRVARDRGKPEAKRAAQLENALKLAKEAVERDSTDKNAKPSQSAKYKLQLVIVLEAAGRSEEAQEVWAGVNEEALEESSLYQQGVLLGVRQKPAEEVAAVLKRSLDARPAARARNQLRKFIRTEPDFAPYLDHASFKDLVTDEPVDEQKKG